MRASADMRPQAGFTILEVTVSMGILGIFMVVLVELISTSTSLVAEGQRDQDLAARGLAATRPMEDALRAMVGPTQESRHAASDARLLVQYMPTGEEGERAAPEVQVLRATVEISPAEEQRLLRRALRPIVEKVLGIGAGEEQIEKELQARVRQLGGRGRAEMMLLPWPGKDSGGVYLELRRGTFLGGQALPFEEAEGMGLMQVEEIGSGRFPLKRVPEHTEVIAQDLLHCSLRLAHQFTEDWQASVLDTGPSLVWDSARVGWSLEQSSEPRKFRLDKGPDSAADSTDDVFPHYVEATLVVGASPQDPPPAVLAEPLSASASRAVLARVEGLPEDIKDNMIKIGAEWVRFSQVIGRELVGLKRGQRGTAAQEHEAGTGLRIGRTMVLVIPVPHAKDDWNG